MCVQDTRSWQFWITEFSSLLYTVVKPLVKKDSPSQPLAAACCRLAMQPSLQQTNLTALIAL